MKKKCPRCMSDDIVLVEHMGITCLVCKHCGFDERDAYDVVPEGRSNQREKGSYSPYKQGGSFRTKK